MIIFTETAHKIVLRRVELIKHFQDKYFELLHTGALNDRLTEYLKAYEAYQEINTSLWETAKSFLWGSEIYEVKNELDWRLGLLHRELDALGEQIVMLKNYLQADNEMQIELSSRAIKSGKTTAKPNLSNVSISPDNSVYFNPGEMPKIYHSPIGVASGLKNYTHIESNNSNTNFFVNSSNSNNKPPEPEPENENPHSLKYGK